MRRRSARLSSLRHSNLIHAGCTAGRVGYVCGNGSAHFAVAIRTAQVVGSHIVYHAGGGIVAASSAANEVSETDLKASVFLDAVGSLT